MGADLYIKSLWEPNYKRNLPKFERAVAKRNKCKGDSPEYDKAQADVMKYADLMNSIGYFRDSYNSTSVLWRLGLSWWQDVKPNEDGCISIADAKKLLVHVRNAPLQAVTRQWLLDNHCKVGDGKSSVEGWNEYYREKRERLIAFLEKSIELNEPIEASL